LILETKRLTIGDMLAMQYSIPLPANYDSALIRERVRARSSLFDEHAGLMHKSFLFNAKEHLYAPFYIWRDVAQARDFLMDELFHGVIETFNRHRVRSWYVVNMGYGNAGLLAGYARREIDVIPPEVKLEDYLANEKKLQKQLLLNPNLYSHVIALDADRWEILHFSLWKDKESAEKPSSDSYIEYEVLHVSKPQS